MARENLNIPAPEDYRLFRCIAFAIHDNPQDYVEVGKWLDDFCSNDAYWNRRKHELQQLSDKNAKVYTPGQNRRIKQLTTELKSKRAVVSPILRLQEAWNYLLKEYCQEVLSNIDPMSFILVTWLLTDRNTETADLNITAFEKIEWNDADGRAYASFLWWRNSNSHWMRILRKLCHDLIPKRLRQKLQQKIPKNKWLEESGPDIGEPIFLSTAQLAEMFNVKHEPLRKRLERLRLKRIFDTDIHVESQERGVGQPRFLYNAEIAARLLIYPQKTSGGKG